MRVTLINHSDTLGGASVVSMRLMEALRRAGVDARMVVGTKQTQSLAVDSAGHPWRRKAAFLAECGLIYTHNGFNRADLFKVSFADYGLPLWEHPWVRDAHVVVLNWVNQGLLSWKGIERIGAERRPMVWTMHDMWCLTGACHHAGTCRRYTDSCGRCPLLGARRDNDLSRRAHARKAEAYRRCNLSFVAVSSWLAERCRESSLLGRARVEVIPNAFPVERYDVSQRPMRAPGHRPVIVMGAARLDDPIKDLPTAIDALNRLHDSGVQAEALFFGAIRQPELLKGLRMPYRHEGTVADPRPLYRQADVVLSSSLYETLPGTIIEGMAAGCVAVATDSGGQRDIIDPAAGCGILTPPSDPAAMADALARALDLASTPGRVAQCHSQMERRFADEVIARRYLALFDSLV